MGYHPKGSDANAQEIYKICKKNGWSTNAICGMLGNLSWESYLNPEEEQIGGGGGYGLAQWPYSTLKEYANQYGVSNFNTIQGQMTIIIDQMNNDGGGQYLYNEEYPGYWISPSNFIKSTISVEDLTYSWLHNYERAGVADAEERVKGAQFWYNFFTKNNSEPTIPHFNGPIPGVDVSDDNEWVSMEALSNAGIKIVYIQTTNGTQEYTFINNQNQSEYFSEAYYKTAKQNGLYVGVYHFAVYGEGTPQKQAKLFYNAIKNYDLDCIPMVDIESSGGFDMGNDYQVQKWFQSFADEFTSLSKLPIGIYATRSALNNTFSSSFSHYPIWVANWINGPRSLSSLILPSDSNFPGQLDNWDNWNGWQWGVCSPATRYSLGGGIDLDVFKESIFLSAQDNYIPSSSSNSNGRPANSHSTEIKYTVEAGNTLSGIAEQYGVTVSELCQWNNISNPNEIYIGETLIIYTNGGASSSRSTETVYTVQTGQTLSGIASSYNVTVQDILNWNPNITNANLIYPGEKIIIYTNGGNSSSSNSIEVTYTVEAGNTLSGIAEQYNVTVDELCQWNNISDPNDIYIGEQIIIYTSGGGSSSPRPSEVTYTVEAGNTLSGIAEQYGVSVGELCQWNNISNPNDIYVGETLIIYTNGGGSSSAGGSNSGGATTGIVNITSGTLNVRAGAGFNWPVIGSLYPGQSVTLGPVVGDWYNIYFGQHGGFVYAPYITVN